MRRHDASACRLTVPTRRTHYKRSPWLIRPSGRMTQFNNRLKHRWPSLPKRWWGKMRAVKPACPPKTPRFWSRLVLRRSRQRWKVRRRDGPAGVMLTSISLERRVAARNQQRFYTIRVAKTRFGAWALGREWGRIGPPGTVRETWFDTESAAIEAGAQLRQRKEKRGYRAVGGDNQAG